MRNILSVVVVFYIVFSNLPLLAQNSSVYRFERESDGLIPQSPLPFGEKVVISGETDLRSFDLSLSVLYGNVEEEVNVSVSSGRWTAIVGPFPKRVKVLFVLREKRSLTDKEINHVSSLVEQGILEASETFFTKEVSMEVEEFVGFILNAIRKKTESELQWYVSKSGESVSEVLLERIRTILNSTSTSIVNNKSRIEKMLNNGYYNQVVDIIKGEKKEASVDKISVIEYLAKLKNDINKKNDFENKALNGLESNESKLFKESLNDMIDDSYEWLIWKDRIDSSVKKGSEEILKNFLVIKEAVAGSDVSGIQSYIGVDLGLVYVKSLSATPFFVTMSPYLKKVDFEKDYKFKDNNIWDIIGVILSPTFGMGVGGDSRGVKPIYYAGVGCRLNRIARLSVGGAYYTPPEENIYKWTWGFSASINVNYVGNLIKLITSAQANINN